MTQPTTATQSNAVIPSLYIALDLGRSSWQISLTDGGQKTRDVAIDRSDIRAGKAALLTEIAKARTAFRLPPEAPLHAVYEAGRDGFWLARWLQSQDVQCLVIDPSSILVDRRAKHRKTDAIDARALVALLIRHHRGEKAFRLVAVPDVEDQDARELGRGLERLQRTRRRWAVTLQSMLFAHGIDRGYDKRLREDLGELRTGDDRPLGASLRHQIELLCVQIERLDTDIAACELERDQRIAKPKAELDKRANHLAKLNGIGPVCAWTVAAELGWRTFDNAKQVGAFLGLAPTPWASGSIDREQGISKAGSDRLRALMIQIGWSWLRYQPDSALTKWFQERFGEAGKRSRRVGIVAVARKLAVALWRYHTDGVIPEGALIKDKPFPIPRRRPCAEAVG